MGPRARGLVTAVREANVAMPGDKYHNGGKPRSLGLLKRGTQTSLGEEEDLCTES